ncbi:MAG: hypothetical protein ACTSRI_13720 [Promethearchaeota archaeon]
MEKQLKFWAKSGYNIFIILLVIAIFLIILNKMFFIIGLLVVIADFIYGYLIFKYLSQAQ